MGVTRLSMIEALKNGDASGFEWLKNIVEPYIHRVLIQGGVHHLQDREEFTQQALLRIVEAIRRFEYKKAGSFSAWSATIARNICVDFHRSRQGKQQQLQVFVENLEPPSPDTARSLDSQLILIVAQSILKVMQSESTADEERRKFAIYEEYVQNTVAGASDPGQVVASKYSITRQQLNTIVFRVRQKLRQRIEDELGFPFPNF